MAAGARSAGLVLFRFGGGGLEVLLVHPGGPFWARKDLGAWTIPKGEYGPGEDPLEAARREFKEETGVEAPKACVALDPVRQKGGKVVSAWAVEGDLDATAIRSSTFTLEWPPRSGRHRDFPEVDRAAWFPLDVAAAKINPGQRPLLEQLRLVARRPQPAGPDAGADS